MAFFTQGFNSPLQQYDASEGLRLPSLGNLPVKMFINNNKNLKSDLEAETNVRSFINRFTIKSKASSLIKFGISYIYLRRDFFKFHLESYWDGIDGNSPSLKIYVYLINFN